MSDFASVRALAVQGVQPDQIMTAECDGLPYFTCTGCMSDALTWGDCDPECMRDMDHIHLHCRECGWSWTESAPVSRGPQSPDEYGEGMDDAQLEAEGWAAGLDVWGPVKKAYGNFVGDGTLANSQLWSLRQAIRAELLAEMSQPPASENNRRDG
jgi:hypothetical protein